MKTPDGKDLILNNAYQIHSYHAATNKKASVSAVCNFCQESAWNHAEHLGLGYSHLSEKKLVLSRLFIRFYGYPEWGDNVTLRTWPSVLDKLLWYREFRLLDKDGNTAMDATSAWVILNAETKRPQRTADLYGLYPDWGAERVFPDKPGKVTGPKTPEEAGQISVRYHDLDVNGHVNNVRYIEWALESLPQEHVESRHLAELEINFLNEAFLGDTVALSIEEIGPSEYLHELKNEENGRVVSRVRTKWDQL